MKAFIGKRAVRITALVVCCIAAVYALIYADVVLRARSAYLQGEKYWSWYVDPALKTRALEAEYEKGAAALEKRFAAGKITAEERDRQKEVLAFSRDEKMKESSIKYAYVWYQTVVELFSPPESTWVKRAREKMPKAKELWKQELRAKNIPFEDYMLE